MKKIWWKEAVVYQIYPRSFCDSDGDGIGDLQGIISKLDYLKGLGVDVLWLSPIYRSPNDDNGYDVSDYRDIMEEFGTMADFDQLLEQVHGRGMKLIMDLILNHTSDEHPWFEESRSSKDNPRRDWYIWRPGKNGREPSNWASIFHGSAWEYDEVTEEYYLHIFSRKQPDLNWRNPEVRAALFDMMRWWLDKGVDGFRLDAINHLAKDPEFPDAPADGGAPYADASAFYTLGPGLLDFLKEMKEEVFDHYDIFTIGESSNTGTEDAVRMVHEELGYIDMIFQFEHCNLDNEDSGGHSWKPKPLDVAELKAVLSRWQRDFEGVAWNSQFFSNHDLPRAVSRFGDDKQFRFESAKLIATVIFTLGGTPFVYQGDEIGMTNVEFPTIDDYRDIATRNAYAQYIEHMGMSDEEIMPLIYKFSRDNARTPMQWDGSENAGFTTGTPWIGVNPNHREINVARELEDPQSVLSHYRALAELRRQNPVLIYGKYRAIDEVPPAIFAYTRTLDGTQATILGNFSAQEQVLERGSIGLDAIGSLAACNYPVTDGASGAGYTLRPYEARVYLGKA